MNYASDQETGQLPRIPLIVGPTASGKTDLAVRLAARLQSGVISCDSVQIYKGLDILSAKPTPDTLAAVKHHCVGILSPTEKWNAAVYSDYARKIIDGYLKENLIPVVSGGTPLWIKALVHGLIDSPEISPEVDRKVDEDYETHGLLFCYDLLSAMDPETAESLHPNDTQRILRALKVVTGSKIGIREYQRRHRFDFNYFESVYVCIDTERQELYRRINERTDTMFQEGAIDEVQALLASGVPADCPAFTSIGYRDVVRYLKKEMKLEDVIVNTARSTRHYAKRQITWYKKYKNIIRLDPQESTDGHVDRIVSALKLKV